MQIFIDLIKGNQSFLIRRVLSYAKIYGYVKYTSTLEEAWVKSISGLSKALINTILTDLEVRGIEVDFDFKNSSISSFGVIEAKKHRHRGVNLEMFLGLMKYYRQAYLDLVTEKINEQEQKQVYLLWINRFFDYNEIAFCSEWADNSKEAIVSELQIANRKITNEKNKYLTIFESLSAPAILLDTENHCINMNYSAQLLLQGDSHSPGYIYYSAMQKYPKLNEILPWLSNEFKAFNSGNEIESTIEKIFNSPTHGKRNLVIKFNRMLDVSDKFEGTLISFADMTEYKKIEEQLRTLSFHDMLTGLYNRNYMEEEINRISTGKFNPVGLIAIDVDGLKLVNDNLGHNVGDVLLINVSRILKKCLIEYGSIIRNGGDEFSIIMPSSDEASIQDMCQRIRTEINEHNSVESAMPISISVGWSIGNMFEKNDIQEILKEADNRMYNEKQTNRLKYAVLFNERFEKYGVNLF